jgi:glycosyltransferase involved in cell wall biosynthesis
MHRQLKVIHVVPSIQRGGAERQVACIVQNCKEIRHYLVALHYDPDNYLSDKKNVKVISGHNLFARLAEFNAYIRSLKPDIIYTWGVLPYMLSSAVSIGRRIKVINGSIRHGIFKRSFGGYLRLIMLHCSKYVVANSMAGLIANRLGKGIVLYNGIDERFNGDNYPQDESAGNRSGKAVFISVANLVPYKDYETVFRALEKLKKEGVDFLYHIIGDGPLRKAYKKMSISMGLNENVFFHGRVADPENYLAQSDIFIHSSKGEGCSNAILEAMYMGLPVIATDIGGTAEITGSNALLFPFRDYEVLYDALSELVRNEKKRTAMGVESYRLASQRFTIDRMISDYKRIMSAIAFNRLSELSDLMYEARR